MISKSLRTAYYDLALASRVVMVGDFETQYAIRSEIRNVIRQQLPLMGNDALVAEINSTADILKTSLVQARWSEDTGAHKLIVRPEMRKNDGSITELNFLTPQEMEAAINGTADDKFESALGSCKSKRC